MLNGDKRVYDVYNEIKTPVFTVIYALSEKDRAEDIMQDMFLRLLVEESILSVQSPRAFLFKMAHNMALDEVRKKTSDALDDEMPDGSDVADTLCSRLDIDSALARLSIAERKRDAPRSAGLKFARSQKYRTSRSDGAVKIRLRDQKTPSDALR
jgi:DNA-directed RNA polymerase specialized sigma24 family protein